MKHHETKCHECVWTIHAQISFMAHGLVVFDATECYDLFKNEQVRDQMHHLNPNVFIVVQQPLSQVSFISNLFTNYHGASSGGCLHYQSLDEPRQFIQGDNYSYLQLSDIKICGRRLLKNSKRHQTFKQRSKSFKRKLSTFNFVSRHRREVGVNQPQTLRQSRRRLLTGQSFSVSSTFLELPLMISWTISPILNMVIQATTRTTMCISGLQQNYTA